MTSYGRLRLSCLQRVCLQPLKLHCFWMLSHLTRLPKSAHSSNWNSSASSSLLQPDLRGTSLSIFLMTAMSSLKRALSCGEFATQWEDKLAIRIDCLAQVMSSWIPSTRWFPTRSVKRLINLHMTSQKYVHPVALVCQKGKGVRYTVFGVLLHWHNTLPPQTFRLCVAVLQVCLEWRCRFYRCMHGRND